MSYIRAIPNADTVFWRDYTERAAVVGSRPQDDPSDLRQPRSAHRPRSPFWTTEPEHSEMYKARTDGN